VALIARRVARLLERRGLAGGTESSGAPDLWSEEAPVLAAVAAASVDGRVALGPLAGAGARRCGDPPEEGAPMTLGPCHAHVDGFDLHAGLVTRAGQRDQLERLCRYALRPPLAQDRQHVSAEGTTWLTLRHRWADGTTHLRFDPLELLERLAVLTPRPRVTIGGVYEPPFCLRRRRSRLRARFEVGRDDDVEATGEAVPHTEVVIEGAKLAIVALVRARAFDPDEADAR